MVALELDGRNLDSDASLAHDGGSVIQSLVDGGSNLSFAGALVNALLGSGGNTLQGFSVVVQDGELISGQAVNNIRHGDTVFSQILLDAGTDAFSIRSSESAGSENASHSSADQNSNKLLDLVHDSSPPFFRNVRVYRTLIRNKSLISDTHYSTPDKETQ